MKFILSFLWVWLIILLSPVLANNMRSDWYSQGPVELRLVVGQTEDHQSMLAVDIRLASGWHTYWHFPGDSGIVPQFDWSHSRDIQLQDPLFETPQRFQDAVGNTYGYEEKTVFLFPLQFSKIRHGISSQDYPRITMKINMGVCRKICIPVEFNVSLNLDMLGSEENDYLIRQALLRVPTHNHSELSIESVIYHKEVLKILIIGKNIKQEPEIIIYGGDFDVFGTPRLLDMVDHAFWIEIPASTHYNTPFIGRSVNILVYDGVQSIEENMIVQSIKGE